MALKRIQSKNLKITAIFKVDKTRILHMIS